ncbi:hypothetical protein DRO61_10620 [Candidatus Bathyarchaeota archaeon]|nr:MAG: hypothetical protein DRO61_10620 [Candidatus Bathyarchaeota archaeon]
MELKDLIGKYTVEGVINFEKVEIDFQKHINGIVTKDVKKQVGKKEAEVMGNFISELGIEADDLEGVKKWVKVNSDNSSDFKKDNLKLDKDFNNLTTTHTDLQKEYTNFKQDTLIGSLGVNPEQAEFLKYKFNKDVTEDDTFESRVVGYKKDNRITTNVDVQNNFEDNNDSDPLASLKKLRENK